MVTPVCENRKRINLVGEVFGELTVVSFDKYVRGSCTKWNVTCSCGAQLSATGGDLRAGRIISCGCKPFILVTKELTAVEGTQKCSKCKKEKPATDFSFSNKKIGSRQKNCKECVKEVTIKHYYGITIDEYNEMLEAQCGKCASCEESFENGSTVFNSKVTSRHIDHCHQTGKVRGLLCGWCNLTLGALDEDPVKIERLIDYILKNK